MPLLDLFWTMLLLFLWFWWIWILIRLVADVFRRDDISGWGKAGWLLFLLFLPYLGAFIYIITQGSGMAERDMARAVEMRDMQERYIRDVAGSAGPSAADELAKLAALRDSGAITEEEFQNLKVRAMP